MKKKRLIFRDLLFEDSLGIKNIDIYLEQLRNDGTWEFCTASDLENSLSGEYEVFVNFYGGYFPQNAFQAMEEFLKKGKGFISFNGMAFETPCIFDEMTGMWRAERKKLSYIRRLNIHSILEVDTNELCTYECAEEFRMMDDFDFFEKGSAAQNIIMVPTKDKYVECEWGSAGSMDSKISCLIKGVNEQGEHISAPAVLIEHRSGKFSGGSWIIVSQKLAEAKASGFEKILDRMCNFTEVGYTEINVKPGFPVYRSGETPSVIVNLQGYRQKMNILLSICIRDKNGQEVFWEKKQIELSDTVHSEYIVVQEARTDGCYSIEADIESEQGIFRRVNQGFLIGCEKAAVDFPSFYPGRDYFIRDGKQTAVIGMTYMSREAGRAFLHIPNTHLWMGEMQRICQTGVNWIRTGIWTNWRTYMLDDGHMDEFALRSIEAFIICAALCGLHVTFTFFSFVPEAWEGSHPYLDRRSIDAQKRFISNITARLKNYRNVDWDLINEPYTFEHPTQKKKENDTFEEEAYKEYVREIYGDSAENYADATDCILDDFSEIQIPKAGDINFAVDDMSQGKNGLVWRDYNMFIHHMFRGWVKELKEHIRKTADHMVTVGQDEGLRYCRPVPMTYGELLDYDAQHTWWLLEDMGWDTIFSKSGRRPLLVQETGVMYVENADGFPRRNEKEIAELLRKKYAYAFGTKSAGVIQWIWNSNYYLNSANESNIGALRCDGSFKPEINVTKDFAAFFNHAQKYLSDIQHNRIAVVFPLSNDFSNKRFAQKSTAAVAKMFTNYLHIDFDGIGEFQLEELNEWGTEIIIVPSPHNLSVGAHMQLRRLAEQKERIIIFTGPAGLNENYQKSKDTLLPENGWKALNHWENVKLGNHTYAFPFDQHIFQTALKGDEESNEVRRYKLGKSYIYHVNVPVELTRDPGRLAEFYKELLKEARYRKDYSVYSEQDLESVFISCIHWNKAKMYTAVNESDEQKIIKIEDRETNCKIQFELSGNGAELFVLTKAGKAAASTGGKVYVEAEAQ